MGNAESDVPTPVERKRRSTSDSAESTLALCCSRALTDVGSGSRAPVRSVAPRARTHAVGAHFSHRVTSKYDIKALIGRGSFSTVVRAENKTTREPRAIKIVDIREDSFDCIKTELTILRQVRHPHVIVLYEAFVTNKCVYMVMELATGGELFDRVLAQGGRYPEREAGQVTGMIVDGVRYLHSIGITHRDLKPENILYYHPGRDSRVVITDFGLSHVVGSKESSESSEDGMRTTCGTPEYIAPEIILRQAYSRAVDMWAVGVIVYVLLSGLMPFKDDGNRKNLYRRIIKADFNYDAQVCTVVKPVYTNISMFSLGEESLVRLKISLIDF